MSKQGFTLLEVMVSVAIMGLIMTLVWSSTSQSLRAKDRIELRDSIFHSADVALRKISDDITVAFLTKNTGIAAAAGGATSTPTPAPNPSAPPLEAAQADIFKTFFIGEDKGDQDSLRFTAFSHMRFMKDSKQSDQCRISYEAVPNPDEPRKFNIIRREDPWLDMMTDVKSEPVTLAEGITKFNLEFYDDRKDEWSKEWDTEKIDWKDKLPKAVRITIVFADPDDETREIPIMTAVILPLSSGPIEL